MTCKNCGADITIHDRKCPYCKGVIDYIYPANNAKGYYNPYEAPSSVSPYPPYTPPDPRTLEKEQADKNSQDALLLSIMALMLGFVILRVLFAVLSLVYASKAQKKYYELRQFRNPKITIAITLSIISLVLAFFCLIFFILWVMATTIR